MTYRAYNNGRIKMYNHTNRIKHIRKIEFKICRVCYDKYKAGIISISTASYKVKKSSMRDCEFGCSKGENK